jgi:hypothetical protein
LKNGQSLKRDRGTHWFHQREAGRHWQRTSSLSRPSCCCGASSPRSTFHCMGQAAGGEEVMVDPQYMEVCRVDMHMLNVYKLRHVQCNT